MRQELVSTKVGNTYYARLMLQSRFSEPIGWFAQALYGRIWQWESLAQVQTKDGWLNTMRTTAIEALSTISTRDIWYPYEPL